MKKQFIIASALAAAGAASAATIVITNDIVTSTTWTSDNVYNLEEQVYVRPGATLTIQPGTVVQSTANVGGSLAVSRGAKIYVNGTQDAPVIMTSSNDDFTNLRVACNEWGNLTIMGKGLIAASSDLSRSRPGNTKTPTGLNTVQMEGLTADGVNDVIYGGNDDNDDSGSISFLSLRYGGKVIGLNNELNGLSLGAVGRETDIHHVEVMNNVDDGIEIWGGAVNLSYVNIWNIGDDSFDIDQGWRGKAQFGLIVQGHNQEAKQGSGWGDNIFEHDGAEDSDAQPLTTGKIANFTAIGQPLSGDGATTWRDNCRMQYANCIFMNVGEELVRFDDDDGDGAQGYGFGGQLSWADTWATAYTNYPTVNFVTNVYPSAADMYLAQSSGYLAEIRNSVMFQNAVDGDDEATNVGVWAPAMNNTDTGAVSPVVDVQRGPLVSFVADGKTANLFPVTYINPCAASAALNIPGVDADDFFVSAPYAGGFSSGYNWLAGWTAVDQYGMTDTSMNDAPISATIANGVVISFQSEFGVVYTIEGAAAAEGPWAVAGTVVGDGSYKSFGDADLVSAGFYRVVVK